MKWTCIVTRSHYWILGKMWIFRVLPWGVPDGHRSLLLAFGVLSVWWKTSAFVSTLFRAVLPQLVPEPIMVTSFITLFKN